MISQFALAIPALLLYELAIIAVKYVERSKGKPPKSPSTDVTPAEPASLNCLRVIERRRAGFRADAVHRHRRGFPHA